MKTLWTGKGNLSHKFDKRYGRYNLSSGYENKKGKIVILLLFSNTIEREMIIIEILSFTCRIEFFCFQQLRLSITSRLYLSIVNICVHVIIS